jgi:uncharacterized protein YbcC (UPF0753/DUF2309 family)
VIVAEVKEIHQSRDGQRMEVLSLVKLASEPISDFWPMQTFIHHNPLHGLEHLPFGEAINQGTRFLGGKGYLSNQEYRNYYQEGRISQNTIDEALNEYAQHQPMAIGNRQISHLEALRAILIHGTGHTAPDVASALLQDASSDGERAELLDSLHALFDSKPPMFSFNNHVAAEQKELASAYILSAWCEPFMVAGKPWPKMICLVRC